MSNEWTRDDIPTVGDMVDAMDGDAERYGASVALAEILAHLNLHYRKVPN